MIHTKNTAVGLDRHVSFYEFGQAEEVQQRGKLTVCLSNVAITLSAPSLLSNTISAITIGLCFMIRQLSIRPPMGVMAFSISAAVVPGAKFCAITAKGPARPLIVNPLLLGPVGTEAAAGPLGALGGGWWCCCC